MRSGADLDPAALTGGSPASPGLRRRRPGPGAIPSLGLAVLLGGAACEPAPPVAGSPGDPLPGLTEEQLARFEAGAALFDRDFAAEEGLGPLFNQLRCSGCHDVPTPGGSGVEFVRKATRFEDGRCDLLEARGGDNIQQRATEALRALGTVREEIPAEATHIVDLVAPQLYGLGLVEAIPEDVLRALEDPDDADGDGISGRLALDSQGRPARFGQKGDSPTVRAFIAGALIAELGLTSSIRSAENTLGGRPTPPEADPVPEPEVDDEMLGLLTDYVRFLVPPARAASATPADGRAAARGEALFEEVGCARCHVPVLETGASDVAALDGKRVALYSDLLLHDLGPDVAGICGASTSPSEVRTSPLMGLRHRPFLMHDGRGLRLERTIERHGGEAARSRAAWSALSPDDREALLRFLELL